MQATSVSHLCNFKFSSSHIFKSKKKDKINLNNISYITRYIKNIMILTCNQCKNINEVFYILFFILSLQHVSTSQFGLATIQVLSSHMWLVDSILGKTNIKYFAKCLAQRKRSGSADSETFPGFVTDRLHSLLLRA